VKYIEYLSSRRTWSRNQEYINTKYLYLQRAPSLVGKTEMSTDGAKMIKVHRDRRGEGITGPEERHHTIEMRGRQLQVFCTPRMP
jgi:hypothetical protein